MTRSIEDVISELWPEHTAHFEPLAGGITNANYRVEVGDDVYAVRLPGEDTELLGIDRDSEIAAGRIAAELGIGPELVQHCPRHSYVVTRFIEGRHVDAREVGEEPMISEISSALRAVHHAGTIEAHFDAFRLVSAYHELAAARKTTERFDYEHMAAVLGRIAAARGEHAAVLCHNDLLTANLLHDGRLRIVDWEYSGMGDPFFDLGNLAVNHSFTAEQIERLLAGYFDVFDERHTAALELFELVSEAREAMWGVAQLAISSLDVDFEAYSLEHARGFFELEANLDLEALAELTAGLAGEDQPRTRTPSGS